MLSNFLGLLLKILTISFIHLNLQANVFELLLYYIMFYKYI
jgi:hypothetical protein